MKLAVFAGLLGLVTGAVQAQGMEGHEMHDMGSPAAVSGTVKAVVNSSVNAVAATQAETESTKAFKTVDAKMHKDMMAAGYTGDADVDFLRNMIPHHQGAVDMANVVLKYGTDAEVRMLAGDVVKAQETEIRWMKAWLLKHGPKDASASDARVEVPATVPQPVVNKEIVTPVPPVMVTAPIVVPVAASVTTPVAKVAAVTVPLSPSLVVTSSVPPVDKISATTAMTVSAGGATAAFVNAMPDAMGVMPEMPAPDAEITNEAPQMEFLDGPVLNIPTETGIVH